MCRGVRPLKSLSAVFAPARKSNFSGSVRSVNAHKCTAVKPEEFALSKSPDPPF